MEKAMKTCPKCGGKYSDALPFHPECEGYEATTYITAANYLVVTYRKPPQVDDAPTMWRTKDD